MPAHPKTSISMPLSMAEPIKAKMPNTVRKRFIVKGRVQRVGYRALVLAFANTLDLKGLTRNLPDNSVEIVCDGTPEAIGAFLKSIDRKGDPLDPLAINVISIDEAPPPPEGEFREFFIDYGRKLTPIERESLDRDEIMILGAGTLNLKVDGVGKDFRNMHSDMNTRFDHMADRYDMIAASLKEAIVHMDRNAEKTDKAIEKSRKETILAVRKSQKETAEILSRSRKETTEESIRTRKEIAKSHHETTAELAKSRKEFAASNRELAKAVNFMIKKLSDKPARRQSAKKRKR